MKKPRLYMMVTTDEYELPTAIADTAEELAEIAGTSEQVVNSQISRYEHGKVKETPFRRVFIEEDNEEMKDYTPTTKICKEAYKKGLSNCQKDKFGCEYCDESVYLKKSGGVSMK